MAVYTGPVGYSNCNGAMLLSCVLAATTFLVACGGRASEATSHSAHRPTTSAEAQTEQGPVDLRVLLDATALGRSTEDADSHPIEVDHSKASLARTVDSRRSQLAKCLTAKDLKLGAAEVPPLLTLSIEIDASGVVLGGSTSPAPGQEGLSLVAGCVLTRARDWLFPARKRRGRTILIVPFVISNE